MKYFLTLSFAFFSLVSFAQNNVLEDQAVRRCEVMPAFGQCIDANIDDVFKCSTLAVIEYIGNETSYPSSALALDISGTVYVAFVIERDGSVSGAQVFRSFKVPVEGAEEAIHELEAESIRAVSTLPSFSPGTQDGKPVRVEIVVPVKFTLD